MCNQTRFDFFQFCDMIRVHVRYKTSSYGSFMVHLKLFQQNFLQNGKTLSSGIFSGLIKIPPFGGSVHRRVFGSSHRANVPLKLKSNNPSSMLRNSKGPNFRKR